MAQEKIAIVGAGTMGYSLALAYARGGYEVTLLSRRTSTLEKARELIRSAAALLAGEGLIDHEQMADIMKHISTTTAPDEAYSEADYMLETVYEEPQVKKEVFSQADTLCPEHTIFMSNTSYLNIFDIVDVQREDKLLITHFFAPPHIIPLVEMVPGEATAAEVFKKVFHLLQSIGKVPICLKKYIPGFIINRIQYLISSEMFWLVEKGYAALEDIDKAVRASLAIRMPAVGVLQSYDFTGLDTLLRLRTNTKFSPQWTPEPPQLVREKVEQGDLGVKTSRGLYDYGERSPEDILKTRDANYLRIIEAIKKLEPLS